jgi:hypothetical protein
MKIETKLSIGDICYFLMHNKVLSSVVKSIRAKYDVNGLTVEYEIRSNSAGAQYTTTFMENELFATKEDLLKSL